jgi:AcrR family transcriptional regulator
MASPVGAVATTLGRVKLPQIDGRASRWDEHRAERRQHVIDAAIRVIEASPPGAEFKVQQIADEADMVRTVLYRHFDGRADLQRAVQEHIVSTIVGTVSDDLTMEGSIDDLIQRTLSHLVDWVDAHPNLYLAAESELGDGQASLLAAAMQDVAERVMAIVYVGGALLGYEFSKDDRSELDAVVFGVIGLVRGTLGHWVRTPKREPRAAVLTSIMARSIWVQIDAHISARGIVLDPMVPLEVLLPGLQPDLAEDAR